jgi:hypothetical protein
MLWSVSLFIAPPRFQIIVILVGFVHIVKHAISTSGALISATADQQIAWSSHDTYAIVMEGYAQAER